MNFLEEENNNTKKEKPYASASAYVTEPSLSPSPSTTTNNSSNIDDKFDLNTLFDFKTILIFFLLGFLLLTLLGINIFTILGNSIQNLSNIFGPFINNFLKALGYSTGTVINSSVDTVADVAKSGIDIADGSLKDIGNLLISSSSDTTDKDKDKEKDKEKDKSLEDTIQQNKPKHHEPKPDDSTNPIQKPISSEKTNWCLVGEFQNKRGCVPITDSDKCLSGQIFPNQAMCLNPTLTPT